MNTDVLFKTIFNFQTPFLIMCTYLCALVLRRTLETFWAVLLVNGKVKPTKTGAILWNEFLWVSPIVIGALFGLMTKTFIWPDVTNGTLTGRLFYGAVCGFFAAFGYSRIRAFLKVYTAASATDKVEDSEIPAVELPSAIPVEVTPTTEKK